MLTFFIGDLLPIIVIMLLGYFSGRRETFSEDQARAFNKLVLNYALPAALFVSITRANREMIFADTRCSLLRPEPDRSSRKPIIELIGVLIS
jgi:malonate transporter and related proteins